MSLESSCYLTLYYPSQSSCYILPPPQKKKKKKKIGHSPQKYYPVFMQIMLFNSVPPVPVPQWTGPIRSTKEPHDNIHEINTWKCPIQTQCGYLGYISHDNNHEINTSKCPIQTQCGYIGYISHDNIHEINTWKCPIQTQCGYIGYISHDNIHEIKT